MKVDLAALKARLAASSQAPAPVEVTNTVPAIVPVSIPTATIADTYAAIDALDKVASIPEPNVALGANTLKALDIKAKVEELSDMLLTKHPAMPQLLRTIHTQIRKDPELVTLLTEEEIGNIVNGLKVQTQTEIVATSAKSAAKTKTKEEKAKLSKLTLDDL